MCTYKKFYLHVLKHKTYHDIISIFISPITKIGSGIDGNNRFPITMDIGLYRNIFRTFETAYSRYKIRGQFWELRTAIESNFEYNPRNSKQNIGNLYDLKIIINCNDVLCNVTDIFQVFISRYYDTQSNAVYTLSQSL